MGQNVVPYEYTHMGRPIRVWANIHVWGRTAIYHGILLVTMGDNLWNDMLL